jgi:hypothetical protein
VTREINVATGKEGLTGGSPMSERRARGGREYGSRGDYWANSRSIGPHTISLFSVLFFFYFEIQILNFKFCGKFVLNFWRYDSNMLLGTCSQML